MGYLTGYDDANGEVLADVRRERSRQESLKADGKFELTCADLAMDDFEALSVLMEEVGEAAHEINETVGKKLRARGVAEYKARLRTELVQVAAVAVAWIEKLDKERTEQP